MASLREFIGGIARRFFLLIPGALLGVLDLYERESGNAVSVSGTTFWTVFGGGLFLAAALTYHDLRQTALAAERVSDQQDDASPAQRFGALADRAASIRRRIETGELDAALGFQASATFGPESLPVLLEHKPNCVTWRSNPVGFTPSNGVNPNPVVMPPNASQLVSQLELDEIRLRDVEAMILAEQPEGHPDGPQITRRLRFKDRLLELDRQRRALADLAHATEPQEDTEVVEARIADWAEELKQTVRQALASKDVAILLEDGWAETEFSSLTGVDPASLRLLHERGERINELLGRYESVSVLPTFDPSVGG